LREERGRLTRLLDALVDAVEKDTEAGPGAVQASQAKAEVVEMARAATANGGRGSHGAGHEDQEDIPNEAARRLMDRIRDRIEAQRA